MQNGSTVQANFVDDEDQIAGCCDVTTQLRSDTVIYHKLS